MRRPSKTPYRKLNADSQRLVSYAEGAMQASSRIEERVWESLLDTVLQKLFKAGQQDAVDAALEKTFKAPAGIYDALMEAVEANSESCEFMQDGVRYQGLLVAAPILAWTRYAIASGPIHADLLATLSAHFYAHILAPDVRMAMAPTLFSIDQLPQSHCASFALTQHMAQAAAKAITPKQLTNPPETAPFLADTRFLLAVVIAPAGAPLFQWQASLNPADRALALAQWQAQATPNIARLLPGCGIELLLPEAYYVACRDADKRIRPASVRAAVHYLNQTLDVNASDLQAIIGGFGEDSATGRVDEYRISFALASNPTVVYGVVWPLFGEEEELQPDELQSLNVLRQGDAHALPLLTPIEEILALLRESGVTQIKRHEGCFVMEACEDCGAPFYLDLDAELVHAEMPEDVTPGPTHFH
jgi:hypothetical protein